MWSTQQARERTPEQTNPEKSNPEVKINNLIFCYILYGKKNLRQEFNLNTSFKLLTLESLASQPSPGWH